MTRVPQDIIDSQPDPRPRRRWDESFVAKNWFAILTVLLLGLAAFRDGGAWIFGQESKIQAMQARIVQLEYELRSERQASADTYVRKDLLTEKLDNINYRLGSIDDRVKKLSEQKR